LTPAGETLYRALIAAAAERNDAFTAALTREERVLLDRALDKLADVARALIRAERENERISEEA
jgi:DNA-binding MarR family transcriptional regulator